MKKKKSIKLTTFFIIILIIFISGYFGIQQFSLESGVKKGEFINVPTYGYIKCEQDDNEVKIPKTGWEMFDYDIITCQGITGNSLIQECQVLIRSPSKDEISKANEKIIWRIGTIGEDRNKYPSETKILRNAFLYDNKNINQEWLVTLKSDQELIVEYQTGVALINLKSEKKGRLAVYFTPYFLFRYDVFSLATGEKIPETLDCARGNALKESNFIIDNILGGGLLSQQLQKSEILDGDNLRSRGARVPYLSNFVQIIPQYNFFDDGMQYCYDKKIYQVEEIITTGGSYKVANTLTNRELKIVDCCHDGEVPQGYFCDDNFEKQPLSESEGIFCNALNPCPIIGYKLIVGKQVAYQECINNVCVTDYNKVECSFNEDCPNGYCEIDNNNPKNNKCVFLSAQDYCGNGICEPSRGENSITCPEDCAVPFVKKFDATLLFIILGFIMIILLMFVIKSKMDGGKGNKITF